MPSARHCRALISLLPALWTISVVTTLGAPAAPSTQPAADLIQLNFPENVELRTVVDYVSDRLRLNILYDEQAVNQKITIKTPTPVSPSALLDVLASALQAKGLVLVDGPSPGWKRVVASSSIAATASPTTQLATTAPPRLAEAVTQVFVLENADAAKVEAVIKPFVTQPGGNTIALAEQHMLIVSDFATNVSRVGSLLKLIDQPQRKVATQFVPIRNLDAQQLAQQLSTFIGARARAQGGGPNATAPPIEIVADPRTNQVLLIGANDAVNAAADLARSLDVPLDLTTRTYQLHSVSPERIDKLIRDLLASADVRPVYRSTVDRDAGLLIVTSTEDVLKRIEQLRQQLDLPGAAVEVSPIRFYKLENTTAAEVLQTIQAIRGEEGFGKAPIESALVDNAQPAQSSKEAAHNGREPSTQAPQPVVPPAPMYGGARSAEAQQPLTPSTVASARQTVRATDATITADPNTNTIIVVAKPDVQRVYEQLIKMLDKRRPQVLIECTIVTLDTTNNFAFGVEISTHAGIGNTDIINFSSFGLSTVGTGSNLGQLTLNPGLGFNGTVINSDVAQIAIRALATNSRAEVISAPKLVVNDNVTGTLASVQEAPFTSVNASTTVATTAFAGYASAGTTITVTPHIGEGDALQLEYTVALNSFTGAGDAKAGTPPPRQTNQLNSKVTIPDGSTIIVGGLNRKNYSNTVDAVPILGQLPLLQYLFSNRTVNSTNSTLFVFIRPVVLRDDKFADLKYYSETSAKAAGIAGDYPQSEPLLMK